MSYTVYTFGYEAYKITDLDVEVKRLGAIVVDVRFSPYARNDAKFNRAELQQRYGAKYVWIQELGNKNYRNGKPIEFMDEALGARRLGGITSDGTSVILLCGCQDRTTCHRTELAKRLNEECGWDVRHLPEGMMEDGDLFAE